MNTDYVLRNLHEAAEELKKAIEAAATDDSGSFMARIVFTYRKLNLAWNSRNVTAEELLSQRGEQHELRCQFPSELSDQISG